MKYPSDLYYSNHQNRLNVTIFVNTYSYWTLFLNIVQYNFSPNSQVLSHPLPMTYRRYSEGAPNSHFKEVLAVQLWVCGQQVPSAISTFRIPADDCSWAAVLGD